MVINEDNSFHRLVQKGALTPPMSDKTKFILATIGIQFLKKVLSFVLGIILVVLVSFLFTQGFSNVALSDRLFIVGMGFAMLGGVVVISRNMPGRRLPNPEKKPEPKPEQTPEEAQQELKRKIEKWFSISTCLFLIGLLCVLLSAAVIYLV